MLGLAAGGTQNHTRVRPASSAPWGTDNSIHCLGDADAGRPTHNGELAHKLSIERTTLSRNLALMEAAAWISIRPGEDARSRLVSVTGKGRAAVSASLDAWRRAQAAVAAAIGPSGIAALKALSRTQLG